MTVTVTSLMDVPITVTLTRTREMPEWPAGQIGDGGQDGKN